MQNKIPEKIMGLTSGGDVMAASDKGGNDGQKE